MPKGHITTVYDPVLNRFQTVGDIPDAIVFTAGTLNLIERGLVDIIDTSAAPNAAYADCRGHWLQDPGQYCLFFKQWGGWGADGRRRSKHANGRLLDGRTWNAYPSWQGDYLSSR